jgi:hypothetical protein
MKNCSMLFFSVILIYNISCELFAQKDSSAKLDYYKVSQVRVYIDDQSDVLELRKQGLGFEHINIQDNYFDVLLDSVQIDKLKKTGYPYEIIIDDMTKDYLERTKESREKIKTKKPCQPIGMGYGSMGGYYTFNEVVAQLDTMRFIFPSLITAKDSIGSSIEGRTIWAVKISDNPDVNENEPQVFYNALTHANEQQGMMTVLYFMYYLLENYGSNPEVTYLVNNRELYFVPVVNPDGYTYNEQISPNGGGMWRKNRRNSGGGIYGIDLNRNYGYNWGYDNIGSSPNPQDWNYRGTGPFSEPETQAIRNICTNKNFSVASNYHTYWDVLFPPWAYNNTHTPDSTTFNCLIKLATALNGYINGLFLPPVENYPSNGDVCDWMYGETNEKNRIFAVLPEVGGEDDGGSWPPPEKIIPLAEENRYANLVYAWGPGIIENPPYIKYASDLNLQYFRSTIDTLFFNAIENNPDNYDSDVFVQVLLSNDSLISEILLDKTDSTFSGKLFFDSPNENFYKIKYRQNGTNIPSSLYYYDKSKLRFTTAGPLVVDSIFYVHLPAQKRFSTKPYLTNLGNTLPITGVSLKIICNDPWIINFPGVTVNFPTIQAGATIMSTSVVTLRYDSTTFPRYFNLRFEIMSGGFCYWKDSLKFEPVIVGVEDELNPLPTEFALEQNYPNPLNPSTTIKYSIPKSSQVTLKIFNTLGEELEILVNEEKPVGTYELNWNAVNIPSGVYFYRLQAGDFVQTRKMILLK